jgi:hypothetical protein
MLGISWVPFSNSGQHQNKRGIIVIVSLLSKTSKAYVRRNYGTYETP